jgi:oxalate---CoA ligase
VPGAWGRRLRRNGLPSLWRLVTHVLARDPAIARRVGQTIRTGQMEFTDASRRTTYYRAMARYVPPRIRAELICLLSEEYAQKKEYSIEPWTRLAPKVRSQGIPGEHNTCISRHVGELAACINRMMVAEASP